MRNPRDLYIRASQHAGIDLAADYFPYSFPLELDTVDKNKMFRLSKILKEGKGSEDVNQALAIFNSWSNRVFLEGLLIYFTVDELSTIPKFSRQLLDTYTELFFAPTDLHSFANRMIFINTIINKDAKTWFMECSTREIEDVRFRLTGKPRMDTDRMDTMDRVFRKVSSVAETFLNIKPSTLQKFEQGISREYQTLYDIGLKSADISLKFFKELEDRKPVINNEADFIQSWENNVKTVEPEEYDTTLNEEDENELFALMEQVNPIKQVDVPDPKKESK